MKLLPGIVELVEILSKFFISFLTLRLSITGSAKKDHLHMISWII